MNFYDSIITGGQRWPKRAREELNTAVLEYLMLGTMPDLDSMNQYAAGAFEMFLPVLKNQVESAKNGKKGAEAKKARQRKPASQPPSEQAALFQVRPQPSEQEQEQEREKPSPKGEAKKRRPPFSPPDPGEVEAYARERGLSIDAQRFCDFYASKGWMVGRNRMTDWRAAARNWARGSAPRTAGGAADGYDATYD